MDPGVFKHFLQNSVDNSNDNDDDGTELTSPPHNSNMRMRTSSNGGPIDKKRDVVCCTVFMVIT